MLSGYELDDEGPPHAWWYGHSLRRFEKIYISNDMMTEAHMSARAYMLKIPILVVDSRFGLNLCITIYEPGYGEPRNLILEQARTTYSSNPSCICVRLHAGHSVLCFVNWS